MKITKEGWWKRFKNFMKSHTGLTVIITAAFLLELTTGVMYYSAQNIIQRIMERLVESEMNTIYLCIRNKLEKVEVTLDNMSWAVVDVFAEPDSLFTITKQMVEHNPAIYGSTVSCIPYLFPEKGRWFEPYAVRREDGSIESMQLGSASHDYTKAEFFRLPIAKGSGQWCEPYLDSDGAKRIVTTYGVPVYDTNGKIIAVVDADISLDWLDGVLNEGKVYQSTRRFLVTGNNNLLVGEDCPLFRAALEKMKADYDKKGYVILKDEAGRKRHVFFTPIGGKTNWILINAVEDNEVFGPLRHVRQLLLLMVLAGLLLIAFIIYRSSRNLERLRQVNAEKERIGSELRVASQIQQSMLPRQHLHKDNVDIYGSLVPAREVGGDLFDYFIRDEKLFFCIGDISGKGVPSAMLMAVTQTLFRFSSAHETNPARIMQSINETICQGNDSNMFATLFIGILDLPTGRLRYCDAGHDCPMLMAHDEWNMLEAKPNLPVGVFDDFVYTMQEMQLEAGNTLFLYTDGLTEAMNAKHEQFGLKRIEESLKNCINLSTKEVLDVITDAVHGFVKGAEQSDDLTMLSIRYTPKLFESTLSETLVIKNDIKDVSKFSDFIKSVIEKLNIEKSLASQLRLAVEEAVVNVIDHAYPTGNEGGIEVRVISDGKILKTIIIDSGAAFDPTTKERTDTSLPVEDRQIGGLGILLIHDLMDSINYERIDGRNVLTLTKIIES